MSLLCSVKVVTFGGARLVFAEPHAETPSNVTRAASESLRPLRIPADASRGTACHPQAAA
jgi:hypothetical protein